MRETTLKKSVKRAGIRRISHGKTGETGALRALRDSMDVYSRRIALASRDYADGKVIQPEHVRLAAKALGIRVYGGEYQQIKKKNIINKN